MDSRDTQDRNLLRLRGRILRFRLRFARGVDAGGSVVDFLAFLASAGAVVALLLYAGFENTMVDRRLMMRILRSIQMVFMFAIVYNFMLRPSATIRNTHPIKWIAEAGIVLSVIAWMVPDARSWPLALRWMSHRYFFFAAVGLYSVSELSYAVMRMLGRRTNPSLILSASFLIFILAGSFVLMMPRFTRVPVAWEDALFLAASAVSMTGLTTVDVAATFTPLGDMALILLMEVGALGVLTFTSFFAVFFSGQRSIYSQLLMRDFIYSRSMSALIPVMLYILGFTLAVEAAGALAIYLTLPAGVGADTADRILISVFHSVAAFTNSGLSTLPDGLAMPQLMGSDMLIYLVMTVLIFAGGIGFPNLVNFKDVAVDYLKRIKARITGVPDRGRRVHVYDLNTKLVLATTVVLFVFGAVVFYIFEHSHALAGLSEGKKIIMSIFYSATPRSAGFAPIAPAGFLNITILLLMFLMWVGGASQSMAGGIKVNTFAAAMLNIKALMRGQSNITAFGRRIAVPSIRRANGVIFLSILTLVLVTGAVMIFDPALAPKAVVFECLSAITTNGLSLGITPELSASSKYLLAGTMFVGRVGLLSMLSGIARCPRDNSVHYPADDIIIN